MHFCIQCGKQLLSSRARYCSNKCQGDRQYCAYIELWRQGKVDGNRGVHTKNISRHIRRYLFEKYKESCSLCLWSKRNQTSGEVPLEIDHIDGNADNNREANLRLLCPNCHALTPSFRNLNKGSGRSWRRHKYKKG